jgi:hypothetical protein
MENIQNIKRNIETWKDVSGFEGYYQISDTGLVKSIRNYHRSSDIILKQDIDRDGYSLVCLSKNSKKKNYRIHRLVWDAFGKGERNGKKIIIDHIDENKGNNNISNLQLLTTRDNVTKYFKTQTRKYNLPVGVRNHGKKYQTTIWANGKHKALGTFPTIEIASQIYEQEKLRITRQQNG